MRSGRSDAEMREKLAWLSDPRHYPRRPGAVEVLETHFAWVFLAGQRAYKLKKPLRQASMDYRTLRQRERACREELRLNRRLAPEVYLAVVPLARDEAGSLTLEGGEVVDWLVQMRRLAAGRMLDRVIAAHGPRAKDIDRLMEKLAAFFRSAQPRPLTDGAYRARLRREIRHNCEELLSDDLHLRRGSVMRVAQAQLAFLGSHPRVFAGRGARVIDGHGDLRPEHVFLGTPSKGACVIDCLEFDPDLRRLDPAEEIAFLALECERLGARRLATVLIERYLAAAPDPAPRELLHFYQSRRAAIRAQIAAWHLRDEAFVRESLEWRARAHSYLADALRHIEAAATGAGPRHARASGPDGKGTEWLERSIR
jgi:aminoglycoside phosphotransferase family enzyme